ncbi:hypothetical protein JTB14_016097 [Gonioctena quinquepunctata]|nr:hypothetical protein JTB14_016097 [Gonioctena quinquepunctata]
MGECHEGFCVRSIKRKVPVTNVPITKNFDLSSSLESVYPLLEIIFSYLNYNDLKSCCDVKRSWKDAAETILKRRVKPSWFTCYRTKTKPKSHYFDHHSDNLNYNNVGLGIILYDFRRIKLNKFICVHTDTTELVRKSVPEYLEDELIPKNVDYCVISCPKVVSYFSPKLLDFRDVGLASIIDGLFLPKIPNIRIATFHCDPLKDHIDSVVETYMNPNHEVKCILLFSTTDHKKTLYEFLKHVVHEETATSVALGGGIIRGTKTFRRINPTKRIYSNNDIFSILFLKDKDQKVDFDAFSYVIYGDDLSRDEFAEEILRFKEQIVLRTHSAAIRICCSAKVDADEEPIIFNKIFPDIPTLGFHADGEIGWNCVLPQNDNSFEGTLPKKAKHKYPKAQHQWSTVFIILTWGSLQT